MEEHNDILTPSETYERFVTFQLEDEVYGLPVLGVKEVLRVGDVTPVPGSRHSVVGVINVRGVIVTVVDTRRQFGLMPITVGPHTRIVILELSRDKFIGLMVDSVSEVRDIPSSYIDVSPVNQGRGSGHIKSIVNYNDEVLMIVDTQSFDC